MTRISEFEILPKRVEWRGNSHRELLAFPQPARRKAGFNLDLVQRGKEPEDWKPLSAIGAGVCELRVRSGGEEGAIQHRVIYVAKFAEAVYVLHVFEKRTRATPRHHIEVARARYRLLIRERGSSEPEEGRA